MTEQDKSHKITRSSFQKTDCFPGQVSFCLDVIIKLWHILPMQKKNYKNMIKTERSGLKTGKHRLVFFNLTSLNKTFFFITTSCSFATALPCAAYIEDLLWDWVKAETKRPCLLAPCFTHCKGWKRLPPQCDTEVPKPAH